MIGCTLPMVVKGGVARSCANMHESWVGHDVRALFREATGCRVEVVNDADAAGVAEMRFGVAKGLPGVVVMLTFGTGIGSGLFVDGVLVPNTEFGHIEVGGKDAELRASAEVRNAKKLSWEQWAERVDRYLAALEACLWPDWIILGGGVSNKAEKWVPLLHTRAQIAVAALRNDAGIVGAAIVAGERFDYSNSSAAARSATRSTS